MAEGLLARITSLARGLPPGTVQLLAGVLDVQPNATVAARAALEGASALPHVRDKALALYDEWAASGLPGPAIALALRAAVEAGRPEYSIEIVWTGPTVGEPPVRQTFAVLCGVIGAAVDRLTVFSFAGYHAEAVIGELRAAAERNVRVRVVLDERAVATDFVDTLGDIAALYRWPEAYLMANGVANASMHVKAAVADDHTALVTSANLTGHAMEKNMELGLLVRGGHVPVQLDRHFDWLVNTEVLVRM